MTLGSLDNPMSLSLAAGLRSHILPGRTIHLRGGTYSLSDLLDWLLEGDADNRITVRPFQYETVVIDIDAYPHYIHGAHIDFIDLWIVSRSTAGRQSEQYGPGVTDLQRGRVDVYGASVRLIGCRLLDTTGIGWWAAATESDMIDCELYDHGWITPDGGAGFGHLLYTQNATGTKTLTNCVMGASYSRGLAARGTSAASVDGYRIDKMISFAGTQHILGWSGLDAADNHITNSCFWGNTFLFTRWVDCLFEGNYIYLPTQKRVNLYGSDGVSFQHNTLVADGGRYIVLTTPPVGSTLDNNHYFGAGVAWQQGSMAHFSLAAWQTATSHDLNSQYVAGYPTENKVVVNACHALTRKVAHVAIFNWTEQSSEAFPVSGLAAGDYLLRNCYDPENDTEELTLSGSETEIGVSFTGRTVRTPSGDTEPRLTLDPRFGAWTLERIG